MISTSLWESPLLTQDTDTALPSSPMFSSRTNFSVSLMLKVYLLLLCLCIRVLSAPVSRLNMLSRTQRLTSYLSAGASKAGRRDLQRITPAEGALAPLFAAAHPRILERRQEYAGAYLVPYGELFEKNDNMKNIELAKDLWKLSEEVVGPYRA